MGDVYQFLDIEQRPTLGEYLEGEVDLDKILKNGPLGMRVLTTIPNGTMEGNDLEIINFFGKIERLDEDNTPQKWDVVILDLGSKVAVLNRPLVQSVEQIIIVTTSELESITNTYQIIKALHVEYDVRKFTLIVNKVQDLNEGNEIYRTIKMVTNKFLEIELTLIDNILNDTTFLNTNKNGLRFF